MNSKQDRIKSFSNIYLKSRYDANKSQEFLASELGVTRKTISSWENGLSSPTFFQSTEWFRALGLNPLPYYLEYLFPSNISNNRNNLAIYIQALPEETKLQLEYILSGAHGSSPVSVIQMMTADLHTHFNMRVNIARTIVDNYEICQARNELEYPNYILPDMDNLKQAVELGKQAAISGDKGYSHLKIK